MTHDPPPTPPSLADELDALREACQILAREDEALSAFDMQGIDRARADKERIDERLRALVAERRARPHTGPHPATLLQQHRELCTQVQARAHRNQLRLEALHGAVRGLVQALRGPTNPGYGAPTTASAQPVLTSCIE